VTKSDAPNRRSNAGKPGVWTARTPAVSSA